MKYFILTHRMGTEVAWETGWKRSWAHHRIPLGKVCSLVLMWALLGSGSNDPRQDPHCRRQESPSAQPGISVILPAWHWGTHCAVRTASSSSRGLYNECREVGSTDRKSSWGLSLSLPLACICWGDSARRISEEKSSRECFIYHFIRSCTLMSQHWGSCGLRGLGLCYRGGPGQVHQCSSSPWAWSSIASPCSKTFPFLLFQTSCHSTWRWDRICDAHIKSHFEDSVSKFLDLLPGFGGL